MLSKQYSHRLPADYDMDHIRRRAALRGPLWDDTQGLYFKAFAMREAGKNGAIGNVYASIYLWKDTTAAADFLASERFEAVVNTFGRPDIALWLPLDARAGNAKAARYLYREDILLSDATTIASLRESERERNRLLARHDNSVAVVSALDTSAWKMVRLYVSSAPHDSLHAAHAGDVYELLHFAQPELKTLAAADA